MPTNVGNGLAAGLEAWLASNPDIVARLSVETPPLDPPNLRIRAGREAKSFAMPWAKLTFPGGQGRLESDRMYLEDPYAILVTIYAIGYNACRTLTELINDWILVSRDQIPAYGYGCTLYPDGQVQYVMEPEFSPKGGDIWYSATRFKTVVGRSIPAPT